MGGAAGMKGITSEIPRMKRKWVGYRDIISNNDERWTGLTVLWTANDRRNIERQLQGCEDDLKTRRQSRRKAWGGEE